MTSYKSKSKTLEEVCVNPEECVFVGDSFFKKHLENLRKQRELGLVFDTDQVCATHGSLTEEQKHSVDVAVDGLPRIIGPITPLDEVSDVSAREIFEIIKGRSPAGISDYSFDPEMHHLPRLNKTYMAPKDGDAFVCMENGIDWERMEELCANMGRLDIQISGEDPALKQPKHPLIFKITDLVEDPDELPRLRKHLESSQELESDWGWRMPPIFLEAIPEANIPLQDFSETMKKIMKLSMEFKTEVYHGTKTGLKTIMYSWMYGAKKGDLQFPEVEEVTSQSAMESIDKRREVAVVGGGHVMGVAAAILASHYLGRSSRGDSFDMWNFKDLPAWVKADTPVRDWEHAKLRRGKGHNKFKRKGKK